MLTRIEKPNTATYALAKSFIDQNLPVAFPTETVYGLGGSALSVDAVSNIFVAKGRPSDNPLIVHLDSIDKISTIAKEITPVAQKLIAAFMPGAITLVLLKKPCIVDAVTANLNSVGIRVPSHPIAHEFLKAVGVPIAAPSANLSTRPSPTNARDVYEDMQGKIPLIIDGGSCDVGIESTVVNVMGDTPIILRPGKITPEEIELVCGAVQISKGATDTVMSPGMKYKHYAPSCAVILVRPESLYKIPELIAQHVHERITLLALNSTLDRYPSVPHLSLGANSADMAQNLFSALRAAEKYSDLILLEGAPEEGFGYSILNRMLKSCSGHIV